MVDTNVIFSALLLPESVPAKVLLHVARVHELVLCDHIIKELRDSIAKKRPDLLADIDVLLAELSYELIIAPVEPKKLIRDPKDQPILNAAIVADVDMIISGDSDFLSLDIERPQILSVAEFRKTYLG